MGKVDEVNRLLSRFLKLPDVVKEELRKLAAFSGPLAMVQLLTKDHDEDRNILSETIFESMKGENIEVLSWYAPKWRYEDSPWRHDELIRESAMSSSSAEVFEIWEKYLSKTKDNERVPILDYIRCVKAPMQEIRFVRLLKEEVSLGKFSKTELGAALKIVADSTCSIVVAKALVEYGADVNFKRTTRASERTPLHVAATKTTLAAAELMKFLLLSGADPTVSAVVKRGKEPGRRRGRFLGEETRTPSMERGAQNISKWLGMTWDQLVKWAEEQRKKAPHEKSEP